MTSLIMVGDWVGDEVSGISVPYPIPEVQMKILLGSRVALISVNRARLVVPQAASFWEMHFSSRSS